MLEKFKFPTTFECGWSEDILLFRMANNGNSFLDEESLLEENPSILLDNYLANRDDPLFEMEQKAKPQPLQVEQGLNTNQPNHSGAAQANQSSVAAGLNPPYYFHLSAALNANAALLATNAALHAANVALHAANAALLTALNAAPKSDYAADFHAPAQVVPQADPSQQKAKKEKPAKKPKREPTEEEIAYKKWGNKLAQQRHRAKPFSEWASFFIFAFCPHLCCGVCDKHSEFIFVFFVASTAFKS